MWGAIGAAAIGGATRLIGGAMSNKSSEKAARMNAAMQMQFARKGIQWKVEDAKAAGVHPLYALGAQTHTFQPTYVGSDYSHIGEMGQDIGRAVHSMANNKQKVDAYTQQLRDLQLERGRLENDVLKAKLASEVAKVTQGSQVSMPTVTQRYLIDGQGPTALVEDKPLERVASDPDLKAAEAGSVAGISYIKTPTGYDIAKSKDAAERLEDDTIGNLAFAWRNRVLPSLPFGHYASHPPPFDPGKGRVWIYHPLYQEWRSVKKGWLNW